MRRSSLKDSAVNLIVTLNMEAGKKKDKRRTEKIFYMDDARTSTFKGAFPHQAGHQQPDRRRVVRRQIK